MAHVGWQRHDRIAGPLPDAANARRGIAFEDGAILGVGDLLRGVLGRLPVRVVRPPLDVVDLLAIELEGNPEFDQRLDVALSRENALARCRDHLDVARSDRGKTGAARPLDVDHASPGEVALEGARRLLFDLGPRRIGNRGKLAMKIIHAPFSPLREPTPSEPSDAGASDGAAPAVGAAGVAGAEAPSASASRNVVEGTKKRVPVTARLKSSSRS